MLKKQSKHGAAGIQHDIGESHDLKNKIDESQTNSPEKTETYDLRQDPPLNQVFQANLRQMNLKETEKEKNYLRRLVTGFCTVSSHNPRRPSGGEVLDSRPLRFCFN